MYLRVLEKGAPLFVQGQEPDAHCVLMSGGVDLYVLPDGPPGSQARLGEEEGGARGRGGSIAMTNERAAAANRGSPAGLP